MMHPIGIRITSGSIRRCFLFTNHHHHHHHQYDIIRTFSTVLPQQQQQLLLLPTVVKSNDISTIFTIKNHHHHHHHHNYHNNNTIDQQLRYYSSTNITTSESSSSDNKVKEMFKKKKVKKSKRQELADLIEDELKSTYNKDKTIYIKLCYTDHDIEEGDIVKAKFHWDSIVNVTTEEFGIETTNGKLEYHVNDDWIKLVPYRLYEVLQFYPCTRKQPLPLRVPMLYDEEYGTRNDIMKLKKVTPEMRKKQKKIVQMGPSAQQWLMKDVIECIVKKCKMDGYTPSAKATLQNPLLQFQYHDTDGNIKMVDLSTKEYVLELARESPWRLPTLEEEQEMEDAKYKAQGMERPGTKNNPFNAHNSKQQLNIDPEIVLKKVKHVLLSQPGALNHIVECLHYDHIWS